MGALSLLLIAGLLGCANLAGNRAAATTTPVPAAPATTPKACVDNVSCTVPCFGAAARDPQHPCRNPALDLAVLPAPSLAELDAGAGCATKELTATWWLCAFGPVAPTRTFGLVGDSHAGHWRQALASVANGLNWRADAITRASCPFSTAVAKLAPPGESQCITWNKHVIRFFGEHPEVSVVFISEHAGASFVLPKGKDPLVAKEDAYIAAWAKLPPSVKHILVIHDTPLNTGKSFGCVEQASAHHQHAGTVCAVPRRAALATDPAVAAATRLNSPRVQVIDLTPFLCSSRLCFPVIGGVLVHKDIDHLTNAFSTTLGPFILRDLKAKMAGPGWGV